jgi:hypothetical protein
METGEIKITTIPPLEKYAPITLDLKKARCHAAYACGYMKGWLIATGRIKEIEEILGKVE